MKAIASLAKSKTRSMGLPCQQLDQDEVLAAFSANLEARVCALSRSLIRLRGLVAAIRRIAALDDAWWNKREDAACTSAAARLLAVLAQAADLADTPVDELLAMQNYHECLVRSFFRELAEHALPPAKPQVAVTTDLKVPPDLCEDTAHMAHPGLRLEAWGVPVHSERSPF